MIETKADCQQFLKECDGDWIVHVVPVEDDRHSVDNRPCILFIRTISTGRTYYFAFDHPDSKPSVPLEEFVNILRLTKNIKWALDRKEFSHYFRWVNVYDANFCGLLHKNITFELRDFETPAHLLIRRMAGKMMGINRLIPLMKHLEAFDELCNAVEKMICKIDKSIRKINQVTLETLGDLEREGICVDPEIFGKYFHLKPNSNRMVFSQYNIYTSTGRPSNRFGGVNYAALNSKDGCRRSFVSRYGEDGRIVVVDYTTFHPRIVCKLTNYELPVEQDIYMYLARLYFQKRVVDDVDIQNAKQLTFRQFFGGVEDQYKHIKYLANLRTYINKQWEFFKKRGYVLTPFFKRKITKDHITDPDPPKVFNYILQAAEGEIAISKLQEVQQYLVGKKTRAIIYIYDAVLYDFHKDDGLPTLNRIREIMSFGGIFPMKTYIGDSYGTIKQISI